MSNEHLQLRQPPNLSLYTRCSTYVNEWFGIDHLQNCKTAALLPEGIPEMKIAIYNALHDREQVSEEMISAIGFRTIVKATSGEVSQPTSGRRELVSLVPRHYRLLSPEEIEQREHEQDLHDFETIIGVKV